MNTDRYANELLCCLLAFGILAFVGCGVFPDRGIASKVTLTTDTLTLDYEGNIGASGEHFARILPGLVNIGDDDNPCEKIASIRVIADTKEDCESAVSNIEENLPAACKRGLHGPCNEVSDVWFASCIVCNGICAEVALNADDAEVHCDGIVVAYPSGQPKCGCVCDGEDCGNMGTER